MKHNGKGRRTGFAIALFCVIFLCASVLALIDVRCVVVRTDEEGIVHIASVGNGDRVVISHINSIYDARVDEHLEVRDSQLVLTKVVSDSQGVREYYGIADSAPHGKWSTIRIFNTEGRDFSLMLNGVPVGALGERKNTHFIVEVQNPPLYRFLSWKLLSYGRACRFPAPFPPGGNKHQ